MQKIVHQFPPSNNDLYAVKRYYVGPTHTKIGDRILIREKFEQGIDCMNRFQGKILSKVGWPINGGVDVYEYLCQNIFS